MELESFPYDSQPDASDAYSLPLLSPHHRRRRRPEMKNTLLLNGRAIKLGLNRSGKSCRLRWVNYLRPGLRKDHLTAQEEGIIIELHALWGNKWSTIAKYLPGRTDNEIKNYWRTHFKKKGQPSQKQENLKTDQTLGQKQKQEQQQQEEEEQQQREEKDEDDMNQIILSHAKENVEELITKPQGSQEQVFMETTTIEQQYWPYEDVAPWSGSLTDQDGLWGGLWNLDDNPPQVCINQAGDVYCKKTPTQNQATHFTCGTDTSNTLYSSGGDIF